MTLLNRMGSIIILVLLTLSQTASHASAQGLISAGVGLGGGVGGRNKDSSGRGTHGAAYVQLHAPVFPIALRFDALLAKTAEDKTGTSLLADAVYVLGIPFVQPYALVGYGKYGIGKPSEASGWNAGVGVRVRTPVVAIYAEARRHKQIERDLLTIGISR